MKTKMIGNFLKRVNPMRPPKGGRRSRNQKCGKFDETKRYHIEFDLRGREVPKNSEKTKKPENFLSPNAKPADGDKLKAGTRDGLLR